MSSLPDHYQQKAEFYDLLSETHLPSMRQALEALGNLSGHALDIGAGTRRATAL